MDDGADHVASLRRKGAVLACLAVAAVFPAHAQTEPVPEPEIAAPDVFNAVRSVRLKLVALRHVTGRPSVDDEDSFVVLAATLRHVYYHARALFRKAHQLTEEIAGDRRLPLEAVDADWRRSTPRPLPEGRDVEPADVLRLVNDADDRMAATLKLLNVEIVLRDALERDPDRRAADALAEMMKINRLLNRMMNRALRMEDVYAQALQAINYAGDLGAGYPARAAVDGNVRPLDVYRRLIACLHLIRQVGVALEVETLDWEDSGELRNEDVAAGDVYDLSTTVASELEYLALHVDAEHTSPPRGEYRRSRETLPVHVFQLVGVLEQQLRVLVGAEVVEGALETGVDADADQQSAAAGVDGSI